MNHTLSTKNYLPKKTSLIFLLAFFFSCSPTIYVLDHKPNFAGTIYKNTLVSKTQKKIKNSDNDVKLLKEGVEQLTTYAFGFLIEESDRAIIDNYSKAKELEVTETVILLKASIITPNSIVEESDQEFSKQFSTDPRPFFF